MVEWGVRGQLLGRRVKRRGRRAGEGSELAQAMSGPTLCWGPPPGAQGMRS